MGSSEFVDNCLWFFLMHLKTCSLLSHTPDIEDSGVPQKAKHLRRSQKSYFEDAL